MSIIAMQTISRIFVCYPLDGMLALAHPLASALDRKLQQVGCSPGQGESRILNVLISGILDIAPIGHVLIKPELCSEQKQFGTSMFLVHIGGLDSLVGVSTTWTVDTRQQLSLMLISYREAPVSVCRELSFGPNTTLKVILPEVRFGNVQRWV